MTLCYKTSKIFQQSVSQNLRSSFVYLSRSLFHSLSPPSLTHTHTHTHMHHTHTCKISLTHSRSLTHTHTLLLLSHTNSLTNTHTLSRSRTHSLSHTPLLQGRKWVQSIHLDRFWYCECAICFQAYPSSHIPSKISSIHFFSPLHKKISYLISLLLSPSLTHTQTHTHTHTHTHALTHHRQSKVSFIKKSNNKNQIVSRSNKSQK